MKQKFTYSQTPASYFDDAGVNTAKRIKLFLVLSFLLLISMQAMTQVQGNVTGMITDKDNKGLPAATIYLLRALDSSLVKAGVSDVNGKFEIPVSNSGDFLLYYSLVGYQEQYTKPFTMSDGEHKLLKIDPPVISPVGLSAVTVTAKKQAIEVRPDRTVINVENSINATGSSAFELLRKSPGMQIDNNDNLNLKGKNGVKIYIDGKMMQLDSKELVGYLKSITSNDIEAIEMITDPGAKYDASGNAGIVNIRLKKNRKFGTNGTAALSLIQGMTPKGNAAINLNYRDKKINLFANAGGNIGREEKDFDLYRIQKDTAYDEKTRFLSTDKTVNAKTGADLFLDLRNTIGVLATVNYTDEDYRSLTNTAIYGIANPQQSTDLRASNSIPGSRTNADFNMNYHYADTAGREINFDADYGLFRGTGRSYQPNDYFGNNNTLLSSVINRNYAPTDIDIYTLKLDMARKLGDGKVEYGAKYAEVTTNNIFRFYTDDASGKAFEIADKSSSFNYREKVSAAYANYQWHLSEKIAVQTGLRLEQTRSEGNLTRDDAVVKADNHVKRNYLDFFPNASITWNLSQQHVFNLSYNRRIDRPTYQNLNPFEIKLDELTFMKGNAFLRPQYTDNITLTHTLFGKINTSIAYSYVKDYATLVTDTLSNALYAEQKNVGQQQVFSFSIGSPLHFFNWWNGYTYFWYSYQLYKGAIDQNMINTSATAYGANIQQSFSIGRDYSAELSGWFNGPSVNLVTWKLRSMGGVDIGIQKLLLHKQATLKISATDIFHNTFIHAKSDFGGVNGNARISTESQSVRVSFMFRFGNKQVKNARERKTGLENEINRIKNSN
jgi:iron complex outermembrane receptor protein